jgi:histidine triad (HIT) family protein
MHNHAPEGYACPFCLLVAGVEDGRVISRQADIVYRDEAVIAFVSSHQYPNNPGHVLVTPNAHFENLYDLPDELGGIIHSVARRIALAMKAAYGCDGVSTRQHNEPAGNQDVWHFHLHVFPRYNGDDLYLTRSSLMPAEQRAEYARRLRENLSSG